MKITEKENGDYEINGKVLTSEEVRLVAQHREEQICLYDVLHTLKSMYDEEDVEKISEDTLTFLVSDYMDIREYNLHNAS